MQTEWLSRMENGSIGEARTRELLIDRFWILERSVDIHGADFIIQPKVIDRSFLDSEPIRMGYVQSKFRENLTKAAGYSAIRIHEDYAFDQFDRPRREFFLLIHTGKEDKKKFYFITASDLQNTNLFDFDQSEGVYIFNYKADLSAQEFTIDVVLNFISDALKEAELRSNKEFLFNYLTGNTSSNYESPLEEKYTLDLYQDISGKSISSSFLDYQSEVRQIIEDHFADSIYTQLTSLLEIKDPLTFFQTLERERHYLGNREFGEEFKEGSKKFEELMMKAAGNNILEEISKYNKVYYELEKNGNLVKYVSVKKNLLSKVLNAIQESDYFGEEKAGERYHTEIIILLEKRVTIPKQKYSTQKSSARISDAKLFIVPAFDEKSIKVQIVWGTENFWFRRSPSLSKAEIIEDTINMELENRWPEIASMISEFYGSKRE